MPAPQQSTFATVPSQRTYVHLTCGRSTTVDGDDFRGLCDAVGGLLPTTTFCASCNRQDRLDRFAWVDTSETLADYRRRVRSTLSTFYVIKRRVILLACVLIVPAALAYVTWRFVPKYPIVAGVVAFLVALLAGGIAYGAYLGTDDTDFRRFR
jgi:hypothetical protein